MDARDQPPADRLRHLDPPKIRQRLTEGFERVLEVVGLVEHAQEPARGVLEIPQVGGRLSGVGRIARRKADDERRDARGAETPAERREVAGAVAFRIGEVAPVGDEQEDPDRRLIGREIGEVQTHGVEQVRTVGLEIWQLVESSHVRRRKPRAPLAEAPIDRRVDRRARRQALEE